MTSLFSTAYWVRKSNESPARVPAEAASIEQDSLAPHPAARQGASRARNCAAISVFSFDGSTAVFFLGRQKDYARRRVPEATAAQRRLLAGGKWGWIAAGHHPRPCPVRGSCAAARRGRRALRGCGTGPMYLGHGLRRPNSVPKFGASVKSSCPTGVGAVTGMCRSGPCPPGGL